MSKSSYYEPCSIQDDIEGSPVLRFLSQVVVGTVGVLACALVFTCFKYKRLESHYSLMTNDQGMDSEIEKRQDGALAKRRRKAKKPDKKTFGKVDTEETNNDMVIEMEDLAGLEVEFT